MTSRLKLLTSALSLALAFGPAAALAAPVDFEVFVNEGVKNRTQGGKVDVTSTAKAEATAEGEVIGEAAFFFPATPAAIVEALSTPEGIKGFSPAATSVPTVKSKLANGWSGEMAIDLSRADKVSGDHGSVLTPELLANIRSAEGDKKYTVEFTVTQEATADLKTVRFELKGGKLFQQLLVTVRVQVGGSASSLVTVITRSKSTLEKSTEARVSLAKRVLRAAPRLLNATLNAIGK
jgi:hypothetical protein